MSSWLDVALLAVLIVLNGVFAMSEISLVTSRRARLQRLIDDKVAGAERARELNADPNRALSTIQVGIRPSAFFRALWVSRRSPDRWRRFW